MNNIYSKLQTARVELQSMKLKQTGENKFAGFKYYELSDILPAINELFLKHKLASAISYGLEIALLTIYNSENPEERIEFSTPMASAQLKGCHDIQNLGATQTYLRRYLYVTALEITESDALDRTSHEDVGLPPKEVPQKNAGVAAHTPAVNQSMITQPQVKLMQILAKTLAKDITTEQIMAMTKHEASKQISEWKEQEAKLKSQAKEAGLDVDAVNEKFNEASDEIPF